MTNLTHLFKVGQKVKILCESFDGKKCFEDGEVKETHADHIIVTNNEVDIDGWYEEGFNIDRIYPNYNFSL